MFPKSAFVSLIQPLICAIVLAGSWYWGSHHWEKAIPALEPFSNGQIFLVGASYQKSFSSGEESTTRQSRNYLIVSDIFSPTIVSVESKNEVLRVSTDKGWAFFYEIGLLGVALAGVWGFTKFAITAIRHAQTIRGQSEGMIPQ